MHSKQYYSNYVADSNLAELNHKLIRLIQYENPNHVLEFGCGTGKNLLQLVNSGISCVGIDISMMNIINAHCKFDLPCLIKGDENYLRNLVNFDCVFTCSVLDHIENIDGIIQEFKRIANKTIFLAETQIHDPDNHYYYHDYKEYGFLDVGFEWISDNESGDGNKYKIWRWEKVIGETGNSFAHV